jgi:hypothetical protein
MPYNANIPQATDQISDSQNDILQNFQSILALVDVNHVTFDDPNQGKHFLVEMPQQAGPAFAPPAGEVALECLASAYGTNTPTLFYLQNGINPVEMASGRLASVGWSFLPSGLLMKWGQFPVPNVGAFTFNFSVLNNPPVFGTIYEILFSIQSTNVNPDPNIFINLNVNTTTTTAIGFNAVARDSTRPTTLPATVYYMAIGSL